MSKNVLVALFDGAHLHHEAAHAWFERVSQTGWASCALTENGARRMYTDTLIKIIRSGEFEERLARLTR